MIQNQRIKILNKGKNSGSGKFVLYWMQASQRTRYNHALEFAVDRANDAGLPLLVLFCLMPGYPGANLGHYSFMLQGLQDVKSGLEQRGIRFEAIKGFPSDIIPKAGKRAGLIITDRGYTRVQKNMREELSARLDIPLIQVESDAVVPVEEASKKEEYAARTIRPKIKKLLPFYMNPLRERELKNRNGVYTDFQAENLDNMDTILKNLDFPKKIGPWDKYMGGENEGESHLAHFIDKKMKFYDRRRNDPNMDGTSNLSPYLHFGQISPLFAALEAEKAGGPGMEEFLEQLIVRRELAINFVRYNNSYDGFYGLPQWCRSTLMEHRNDPRPYIYGREELEAADTHDPYWNAAQLEMMKTGKMHGYMRMYWGKKILEWSENPVEAYDTLIYLNDTWELDGRDPNGYTGVAWCFGKHDRPWSRRSIFGSIRYMNDKGLKRKFDADAYVKSINKMKE